MKRICYVIKDKCGTTLVESLCGLVIISLIFVTIFSGFVVAGKIFGDGDTRENNSQGSYSDIESGEAMTYNTKMLTLNLGSQKITFQGDYIQSGEESQKAALYSFETKSTSNIADNVRDTYINKQAYIAGLTQAQKLEIGYTAGNNLTNSPVRDWIRKNIYNGTWPTMPKDFLERYLTEEEKVNERKNGGLLSDSVTIYVQPYTYHLVNIPKINCYVFAGPNYGDNWNNIKLIYDHESKVWYYRYNTPRPEPEPKFSILREWMYVKADIQKVTDQWRPLI